MTRSKPVLDPYCALCGSYKGIGYCRNKKCPSHGNMDKQDQSFVSKASCVLCSNAASVACIRCGNMYCDLHSANSGDSNFCGLDHHIGICSICLKRVCENCWILDETGKIDCIEHIEEG